MKLHTHRAILLSIASLTPLQAAISFTGETMEVLGTTYSTNFIDPANGDGNLGSSGTIAFDSAIDINDLFLEVGQNVRSVTVAFTFAAGGGSSLTGFTESFFDIPNNGNVSYTRDGAFTLGTTGATLGAGTGNFSQNGITLLNFTGSGAVESITITGTNESLAPLLVSKPCQTTFEEQQTFGYAWLNKNTFTGFATSDGASITFECAEDVAALIEDGQYYLEIMEGPDAGHSFEVDELATVGAVMALDNVVPSS